MTKTNRVSVKNTPYRLRGQGKTAREALEQRRLLFNAAIFMATAASLDSLQTMDQQSRLLSLLTSAVLLRKFLVSRVVSISILGP